MHPSFVLNTKVPNTEVLLVRRKTTMAGRQVVLVKGNRQSVAQLEKPTNIVVCHEALVADGFLTRLIGLLGKATDATRRRTSH
jgi:hypothetical protein